MKVKDIHSDKTGHSTKDLEQVIEAYKESLDRAIESNLLFPFMDNAGEISEILNRVKERIIQARSYIKTTIKDPESRAYSLTQLNINLYDSAFKFYFMGKQLPKVVNMLKKNIPEFEEKSISLKNIKLRLADTIELEVLPNDLDGEKTYFGRGKLIMLTAGSKGYHVFDISTTKCDQCERPHLEFKTLTKYGLNSIEEAIEKYVDPTVIGTVAIARNTECYPLAEIVIPIIGEKYAAGLGWNGRGIQLSVNSLNCIRVPKNQEFE